MKQPNWTRILTILLVILASYALLYISLSFILRFSQAILLFVSGAILAYVLSPLVNRLTIAFRYRSVAILLSYFMLAALSVVVSILLFTPFVDQSKSLSDNLHNPAPSSLKTIVQVERDSAGLQVELQAQTSNFRVQGRLSGPQIAAVQSRISTLQQDVVNLRRGKVSGRSHTPRYPTKGTSHGLPPYPQPQTGVPPSYAAAIAKPLSNLAATYTAATQDPLAVDEFGLRRAFTTSKKLSGEARRVYRTMATTPILLLRAQTWLDQHHLPVDVSNKFGQVAQQVSGQGTLVLDNAITILQGAANALLDITLILIIAFYFLLDGRRIVRRAIALTPANYRESLQFFLASTDRVLGGYVRGQIFLSLLAGVLGGGGAATLGVPYPLLIGLTTAILEAVPVIGPLVVFVPAILISVFFNMPVTTTILLFAWFTIFQQFVTNILGPRVMGMAVGIHPLEALLAVLVGYPVGSFLGAFLAVPVAGVIHILIREAYRYFAPSHRMSPATEAQSETAADIVPASARPQRSADVIG